MDPFRKSNRRPPPHYNQRPPPNFRQPYPHQHPPRYHRPPFQPSHRHGPPPPNPMQHPIRPPIRPPMMPRGFHHGPPPPRMNRPPPPRMNRPPMMQPRYNRPSPTHHGPPPNQRFRPQNFNRNRNQTNYRKRQPHQRSFRRREHPRKRRRLETQEDHFRVIRTLINTIGDRGPSENLGKHVDGLCEVIEEDVSVFGNKVVWAIADAIQQHPQKVWIYSNLVSKLNEKSRDLVRNMISSYSCLLNHRKEVKDFGRMRIFFRFFVCLGILGVVEISDLVQWLEEFLETTRNEKNIIAKEIQIWSVIGLLPWVNKLSKIPKEFKRKKEEDDLEEEEEDGEKEEEEEEEEEEDMEDDEKNENAEKGLKKKLMDVLEHVVVEKRSIIGPEGEIGYLERVRDLFLKDQFLEGQIFYHEVEHLNNKTTESPHRVLFSLKECEELAEEQRLKKLEEKKKKEAEEEEEEEEKKKEETEETSINNLPPPPTTTISGEKKDGIKVEEEEEEEDDDMKLEEEEEEEEVEKDEKKVVVKSPTLVLPLLPSQMMMKKEDDAQSPRKRDKSPELSSQFVLRHFLFRYSKKLEDNMKNMKMIHPFPSITDNIESLEEFTFREFVNDVVYIFSHLANGPRRVMHELVKFRSPRLPMSTYFKFSASQVLSYFLQRPYPLFNLHYYESILSHISSSDRPIAVILGEMMFARLKTIQDQMTSDEYNSVDYEELFRLVRVMAFASYKSSRWWRNIGKPLIIEKLENGFFKKLFSQILIKESIKLLGHHNFQMDTKKLLGNRRTLLPVTNFKYNLGSNEQARNIMNTVGRGMVPDDPDSFLSGLLGGPTTTESGDVEKKTPPPKLVTTVDGLIPIVISCVLKEYGGSSVKEIPEALVRWKDVILKAGPDVLFENIFDFWRSSLGHLEVVYYMGCIRGIFSVIDFLKWIVKTEFIKKGEVKLIEDKKIIKSQVLVLPKKKEEEEEKKKKEEEEEEEVKEEVIEEEEEEESEESKLEKKKKEEEEKERIKKMIREEDNSTIFLVLLNNVVIRTIENAYERALARPEMELRRFFDILSQAMKVLRNSSVKKKKIKIKEEEEEEVEVMKGDDEDEDDDEEEEEESEKSQEKPEIEIEFEELRRRVIYDYRSILQEKYGRFYRLIKERNKKEKIDDDDFDIDNDNDDDDEIEEEELGGMEEIKDEDDDSDEKNKFVEQKYDDLYRNQDEDDDSDEKNKFVEQKYDDLYRNHSKEERLIENWESFMVVPPPPPPPSDVSQQLQQQQQHQQTTSLKVEELFQPEQPSSIISPPPPPSSQQQQQKGMEKEEMIIVAKPILPILTSYPTTEEEEEEKKKLSEEEEINEALEEEDEQQVKEGEGENNIVPPPPPLNSTSNE